MGASRPPASTPRPEPARLRATILRLFLCAGLTALSPLGLGGRASAASSTIEGVYALDGVKQQVAGELVATPMGTSTDLKLDISFRRMQEKNALKRYETELTKEMHVIAVSDDLTIMLHHHVAHVIDGHGQDRMRFPRPGLYHIYVDAAPKTIGQQVMRFDLTIGDDPATPLISRPLGMPVTEVTQGLYTLDFDRLGIKAGEPAMLTLRITELGKPAHDLQPFLGVGAHIVLIGAETLDYLHVHPMEADDHPMEMGGQSTAIGNDEKPDPSVLKFHIMASKPGPYRLWVQFIGGRTVYTVPFVAVVK